MEYAWYYDLVLLYVVYSFLGWVAETVVSAARGRGFVDRGFAAGPFWPSALTTCGVLWAICSWAV